VLKEYLALSKNAVPPLIGLDTLPLSACVYPEQTLCNQIEDSISICVAQNDHPLHYGWRSNIILNPGKKMAEPATGVDRPSDGFEHVVGDCSIVTPWRGKAGGGSQRYMLEGCT